VVGCRLENRDGSLQLSAGSFPSLAGSLARLLLPRASRKYRRPRTDRATRVGWVTGCCLLLRRECLEELGGFDEDYFLYYEDVDLCRRAMAHGWSVWYEPALRAVHARPLHAREVTVPLRVVTRHALLTYGFKHWPRRHFLTLAGLVRAEAWLRRAWAVWRRDPGTATAFRDLGVIARHLTHGRRTAARRRLERVIRREERCRAS
jgi:GT2 family glycosyltransferase